MSRLSATHIKQFDVTAFAELELKNYFSSLLENAWKNRRNIRDHHGSTVKDTRMRRSALNEIIHIDIHPASSFAAWSRADGSLSVVRPSVTRSERHRDHSLIDLPKNVQGDGKIVYSISWNPNESQFATVGNNSTVKIWNVVDNNLRLLKELKTHSKAKNFITIYDPSGAYLLVVTKNEELYVFDVARGYEMYSTYSSEDNDTITSVCWSNDSVTIFAGYKSGFVRVFNLEPGSLFLVLEKRNHMKAVISLKVDPMGRALLVGSRNDCMFWSLPNLIPSKDRICTETHILSIGTSFDGSIISIASSKKDSDLCMIDFYWYNDLSLLYSISFGECSFPAIKWSTSSNIFFATSSQDKVVFADITSSNPKVTGEQKKVDSKRDSDKTNKNHRNISTKPIREREPRFSRKREGEGFKSKSEIGRGRMGFRSTNSRW